MSENLSAEIDRWTTWLFLFWKTAMGKNGRTVADPKRLRRIRQRITEGISEKTVEAVHQAVSDVAWAIEGAGFDDWLMARDPRSPRRYDGIETILRDREQVERLCDLAQSKGHKTNSLHPAVQFKLTGKGEQ